MQINPFIKFIFAVVFISCAFQFALLIPIKQVEQKGMCHAYLQASEAPYERQAEMYQFYYQEYIDEARDKVVFSIPYITDYTYQSLKDRQLQLGLDLQGGMQFTLSIDSESFLKNLTDLKDDPSFTAALLRTSQQTELSHPEYIDAFFDYYQKIEAPERIIQFFSHNHQLNQMLYDIESIDHLKKHIHLLSQSMIDDTRNLLHQRLNVTGLGQAQFNIDVHRQNLQIEVPGAKDPERTRELITRSAALEFWNVYRVTDANILEGLLAADQLLTNKE